MIGEEELSFHSKKRKVAGEITLTDRETGKKTYFATAQCVHCGGHWQVVPGSGKRRGYCLYCQGLICGVEECIKECVPVEAKLEIWEGNKKTTMKYISSEFVQKTLRERRIVEDILKKLKI